MTGKESVKLDVEAEALRCSLRPVLDCRDRGDRVEGRVQLNRLEALGVEGEAVLRRQPLGYQCSTKPGSDQLEVPTTMDTAQMIGYRGLASGSRSEVAPRSQLSRTCWAQRASRSSSARTPNRMSSASSG